MISTDFGNTRTVTARVYAPWRYAPVTVCSVEFELRPTRGVPVHTKVKKKVVAIDETKTD